mmetsp:Transcript_10003/g.20355  ORF Transcript_10003/g.20355 Transcript_10003/m.20355 type:complete len:90 (+) Transcript_10003:497-766(+)
MASVCTNVPDFTLMVFDFPATLPSDGVQGILWELEHFGKIGEVISNGLATPTDTPDHLPDPQPYGNRFLLVLRFLKEILEDVALVEDVA